MEPKKIVKGFSLVILSVTLVIVGMTYGTDEEINTLYERYNMTTQNYMKTQLTSVVDELNDSTNTPGDITPPGTSTYPTTSHGHVAFRQTASEWSNITLGPTTVGKGGCGLCSSVAALAYFGYTLNPQEMINFLNTQSPGYCNTHWKDGCMQWSHPKAFVDLLNNYEQYGQYELVASTSKYPYVSNATFTDFISDYLADDTIIMISASEGLFTTSGHIMTIVDYSDDTKTAVHIMDSSGVAASYLGITWEDALNVSWPVNDRTSSLNGYITTNEDSYHIKAMWAIRRVS